MHDLLNAFAKTEADIKEIQFEANKMIKLKQDAFLTEIESEFQKIGWTKWSHEQHIAKGQYERLTRAMNGKSLKLKTVDFENKSGTVEGSSIYNVSADGCTCSDYAFRNYLPCKHMYFLLFMLMSDKADVLQLIDKSTMCETKKVPRLKDTVPSEDKKIFVLTGSFNDEERSHILNLIENFGGRVSISISKKTDYLIARSDASGLKLQKAKEYGTKILSETDFFNMIKKTEDNQ